MPKGDTVEREGRVIEALANEMYRVELATGQKVLVHVAGSLRLNYVRVLPGDRVLVDLSPYDLTRGRITGRLK
jgi:translation initiation factor IF-1